MSRSGLQGSLQPGRIRSPLQRLKDHDNGILMVVRTGMVTYTIFLMSKGPRTRLSSMVPTWALMRAKMMPKKLTISEGKRDGNEVHTRGWQAGYNQGRYDAGLVRNEDAPMMANAAAAAQPAGPPFRQSQAPSSQPCRISLEVKTDTQQSQTVTAGRGSLKHERRRQTRRRGRSHCTGHSSPSSSENSNFSGYSSNSKGTEDSRRTRSRTPQSRGRTRRRSSSRSRSLSPRSSPEGRHGRTEGHASLAVISPVI